MYEPEERSGSLSRILIPLGAIAVVVAIVAGAVFGLGLLDSGNGKAEPQTAVQPSPTVAPTATQVGANPAELAIGEYVRTTLGAGYAGDCSIASINQPPATAPTAAVGAGTTPVPTTAPAGNTLCSQSRGDREDVKAYVLGQPLAEPTRWIFVRQNGGAFDVVSSPEITQEMAAIPGIPWPIVPGAEVVVTGAAPCLNVREGPALNQAAVDCIAEGTTIKVASGPADSDGYQWWQVDGRAGWVVSLYLRYPDSQ